MDKSIEKRKICIIGSGFSGLCAAVQLIRKLDKRDFIIFDQNNEVGGTWFTNTYPGCVCDIPSHLYSFSFEPKPDWSHAYASQSEILAYLKSIAKRYGLYKHIRFRRVVQKLNWVEASHEWKAEIMNMETGAIDEYYFGFVIIGSGQFHLPNLPSEFMNFQGPRFHTSQWDHSIDMSEKVVAVIGSGATAVQLIPEIVGKVKRLISYQRRPGWVIPKLQYQHSAFAKWSYASIPGLRRVYRSLIFLVNEANHFAFQRRTLMSRIGVIVANVLGRWNVRYQLPNDTALRETVKPRDSFGCSRPCLSSEYYRALALPNVTVITSNISCVGQDYIETEDGTVNKVDILVLATGFRIHDYFEPIKIFGENGQNIMQKWKSLGPSGLLGTFFNCTPNMFFIHGPGSDVGHNTGILVFECQTDMIIKVILEMQKRNANRICLKTSNVDDYMEGLRNKIGNTVWGDTDCDTPYKNANGLVTLLYPGTLVSFWWKCKRLNPTNLFDFG